MELDCTAKTFKQKKHSATTSPSRNHEWVTHNNLRLACEQFRELLQTKFLFTKLNALAVSLIKLECDAS